MTGDTPVTGDQKGGPQKAPFNVKNCVRNILWCLANITSIATYIDFQKTAEPLYLKLPKLSYLVLVVFIKGHIIVQNIQFCLKTGSCTQSFNPLNGNQPLKMGPI